MVSPRCVCGNDVRQWYRAINDAHYQLHVAHCVRSLEVVIVSARSPDNNDDDDDDSHDAEDTNVRRLAELIADRGWVHRRTSSMSDCNYHRAAVTSVSSARPGPALSPARPSFITRTCSSKFTLICSRVALLSVTGPGPRSWQAHWWSSTCRRLAVITV